MRVRRRYPLLVLTERFNNLYRGLSAAFVSYDDTPRSAETVVLLAGARARLEDARHAIWLERRQIMQTAAAKHLDTDGATHLSPVFTLNHER